FLAGLGPLVRPELALASVVFLALLAATRQSWRHLGWLVALAGTVPVVYQVWRMSYYALPYPLTAVAKDAGGSKWGKGFEYLWDLLSPYVLLLPLIAVLAAGLVSLRGAYRDRPRTPPEGENDGADGGGDPGSLGHRVLDLRVSVRSPRVVTAAFLMVALIMLLYVTRVGGDFMHGRV